MPLRLNGSTSGYVELAASSVAGNVSLTLPSTAGSVVVNGANSAIVSGTAQNSTSGTAIDFTGIPSWVKRVTVIFNSVSTNGASNLLVQLGTSGGIVNTGYTSTCVGTNNAGGGTVSSTAGYVVRAAGAAGGITGHMTITNVSGNTWASSIVADTQVSGVVNFGGGTVALAAVLTTVRITSVTPDTFDAGSLNIMYE